MITPGTLAFDALGDPAPPARLVADGWAGRTFYICQANMTNLDGQKITEHDIRSGRDRINRHLDAGMWVMLNYESSASRWTSGEAGGQADGRPAADIAHQLGCPTGVAVLVSDDTDTRDKRGHVHPAAVDYAHAFNAELVAAGYTFGQYGGTPVIAAVADVCAVGWQAMADSWSPPGVVAEVHMRQRRPTLDEVRRMSYIRPTPTTWSLDANVCLLSFPAWGSALDPPPPDPPPPDPPPAVTGGTYVMQVTKSDLRPELRGQLPPGDVRVAQVHCLGLYMASSQSNPALDVGPVDGDYGPRTVAGVQVAQALAGVPADGWVGPATWGAWLNASGQ